MSATGTNRLGGRRWAIAFADICLLLLGFSLIAGAHARDGAALADGIRTRLGGHPIERRAIDPARLFEPGEAVLRAGGPPLGRYAAADRITIESRGADPAADSPGARFDGWELAAARTAAVARAIATAGADPAHIAIDMAEAPGERQRLAIVRR